MSSNPFSLTFGAEPQRLLSRDKDINDMVETFTSETPSSHVYVITGVRGAGKTVTMSALIDRIRKKNEFKNEGYNEFIVITLNPQRDLLSALAANLYEEPSLKRAFTKAKISLSYKGITIGAESTPPSSDVEVQLKKMLSIARDKKMRILLAVDEAVCNKNFKVFLSAFQMFLIEKYPVFLIMTGLYKNITSLQNDKSLTFLLRAPKHQLEPLSTLQMSHEYEKSLGITEEESIGMAKFTKGYPYAYQVLGYLKFENSKKSFEELTKLFDEHMEEYAYEKIWSELSEKDKEITTLLLNSENGKMKVKAIKDATGLNDKTFPIYKKRLEGMGVIQPGTYGECELALPRFKEIALMWA